MAAPVGAWGFGFGDIELQSALNQPFRAEIEITATAEELESLEVSLADQAAFDRAGLFRAGFLASLRFDITRDASGQMLLVVTSNQSITEPFVTMLLEAQWARGRVLREYTALLDPPTMLPGPEGPVPVSTPESGGQSERVAGGAIQRESAPAPQPVVREPAPAPQPAAPPRAAAPQPEPPPASDAPGTYGPVQRGETLWAIANEFRPSGVSMNQMLVALYRANPEAFDGNMNLLRRGAILRIPGASELGTLSAANASSEVAEQTAAWQARRGVDPQLRLVPPSEDAAVAGPAAGGDAEPASEPASSGSGAEVESLRGQVDSLESELEQSRRIVELRDQELADLQRRITELEDAVEEAQSTAADASPAGGSPADTATDTESEPLFADEAGGDAGGAVESASGGAEPDAGPGADTDAGGSGDAAEDTPAPAPSASSPDEPSLVSRVLGWVAQPFVLIGIGAAVVLLAGFSYVRRRRAEVEDVTGRWEAFEAEVAAEDAEGADHEATARLRRQIDPADQDFVVEETQTSGQTGRFSALDSGMFDDDAPTGQQRVIEPRADAEPAEASDDTLSSQTVINLDQADPVAEADFHMAYGLYDQAADLMVKALEGDPGNREYRLKLLEVYFVWGNKESFLDAAKTLRNEMGASPDADWGKVVIMGKQICPDEPMFAEAQAAAGEIDLDLEAGGSSGLDFAFDEEPETDLSLEATAERPVEYSNWREGAEDADMLEIGATTAAGLDAAFAETGTGDETEETQARHDADSLEPTQESPTIEQPYGGVDEDDDWSASTQESPTIEREMFDTAETTESPTLETPMFDDETGESPTIEHATDSSETSEVPTMETPAMGRSGEYTAELDLDDLGLNVSDFDSLPEDLGDMPAAHDAESDTREQPAVDLDDEDDQLLSATGVTQVLSDEDSPDFEGTGTSVLGDDEQTMMAPGSKADQSGVDFDLGAFGSGTSEGDTVEQPQGSFEEEGDDIFSGSYQTPVDLDVGSQTRADDEPTDTSHVVAPEPQTMTEVGTKLDLARAYIDMGDPEGARSILEEVLEEGDSAQRREAKTLLDALGT